MSQHAFLKEWSQLKFEKSPYCLPADEEALCPTRTILDPFEYFHKIAILDIGRVHAIAIPDLFVKVRVGFFGMKIPQARFVGNEAFTIVHIQHSREEIVCDVIEEPDAIGRSEFQRRPRAGSRKRFPVCFKFIEFRFEVFVGLLLCAAVTIHLPPID